MRHPVFVLRLLGLCLLAAPDPAAAQALARGLSEAATIELRSPAFADGEPIPRKYTCDGEGIRPPLEWGPLPAATRSLAVFIDDAGYLRTMWGLWSVYNLPGDLRSLPEGAALPAGSREGQGDWGKVGYDPPCPKSGKRDYYVTLYALNQPIEADLGPAPLRDEILNAMDLKVVGTGRLKFTYERAAGTP